MREKLTELVNDILSYLPWGHISTATAQEVADHLIANGVTFAKDNNVPSWIPVTERLPEKSGEYLTYCGEFDGFCVIYYEILKTKSKWRTNWKEVTHWMPLPEAPKEVE